MSLCQLNRGLQKKGLSPDRSAFTSEVNASVKSSDFVSRCLLEASVL